MKFARQIVLMYYIVNKPHHGSGDNQGGAHQGQTADHRRGG